MSGREQAPGTARVQSVREQGFTLVELVMALAIIGGAFLSVLWMRTAAVSTAAEFTLERKVQRIAQEKLDEVLFGIEQEQSGEIPELPEGEWEVAVQNIGTIDTPLYATTLTVRYATTNNEQKEYPLSSWILFPPEDSVLQIMIDSQELENF